MSYFLIFSLGASLGSFFGLFVDRFPEQSIISPRSSCNYCHTQLRSCDLIPIFSQLLHKSRCRFCGTRIPLRYALIELFCGVLTLLCWLHLLSLAALFLSFFGLILSLYDLESQSYPLVIWIIFSCIFAFFYPPNTLCIIFLLLGFLAYKRNIKMGSGDFLFLATLATFFTFQEMLWLIQMASLLGIAFYLLTNKKGKMVAFVPFLFTAFLIVLIFRWI